MTLNTEELDGTVFICDNLPFLKALDSESVDLVCIDPPFAKNETFTGALRPPLTKDELKFEGNLMASWGVYDEGSAYELGVDYPDQTGRTAKFEDIWSFPVRVTEEFWQELEAICPGAWWLINASRHTRNDSLAAYLAFMVERLLEIRRILKPTGSVYLHCDDEANAYLRMLLDAVFGIENFRSEIIWRKHSSRQRGSQHAPRSWGATTDTILYYSKSSETNLKPWRELTDDEVTERFPNVDPDGRRWYDDSSHIWSSPNMGARPNLCYEWNGYTNPHASGWRLSKARLQAEYEKGNIVILDDGRLQRRKYLDDYEGEPIGSLWTENELILAGNSRERTGYPTQKPQSLAKRIILASTEPGDIVLDCFAGCAYVPVAAQLTGRRWIACDASPRAWTVVRRQFHKHPDLGIITEGEIPPNGDGLKAEPKLATVNRVIKVRGPGQLPVRTSPAELQMSVPALTKPVFRSKPVESDQEIWQAFVDRYGTTCWYCGMDKSYDRRELQLDHIDPNKRDGTNNDRWNRALACVACNSDKSNRLSVEETMRAALSASRIPSEARLEEIKRTFKERNTWARITWEEIKPAGQGQLAGG